MSIRTRLVGAMMSAVALTAVATAATASADAPVKEVGAGDAQARKVSQAPSSDKGKPDGGKDKDKDKDKDNGVPEEAVKLLAAELRISVDRARQVYRDLAKVKSKGEAALKDPEFVAVARGLGLSPEQLLAVLRKVKQELGSKLGDKPGNGSATK